MAKAKRFSEPDKEGKVELARFVLATEKYLDKWKGINGPSILGFFPPKEIEKGFAALSKVVTTVRAKINLKSANLDFGLKKQKP